MFESGREIDINKKDNNGKIGLDYAKQDGNTDIVQLIESFQMKIEDEKKYNKIQNENEEEQKRKEAEKNLEEQRKKIEEEKRKLEEEKKKMEDKERERKEAESKRVTYDIEYNTKSYLLKTTAQTLSELENDIKSKLKLQGNTKFDLEFKDNRNGRYIVLEEMEDLEDGMTIKVSTVSTAKKENSKPSVFLTHTWVKDELNRENHSRVATVNELLKSQGFKTWFDEDRMVEHIYQKMAEGIDDSDIILVFISKAYMEKLNITGHDNCKKEFTYAITRKKKMLPIVMEPCMRDPSQWVGNLGVNLAGDLYVDMSETGSESNNIKVLIDQLNLTWAKK